MHFAVKKHRSRAPDLAPQRNVDACVIAECRTLTQGATATYGTVVIKHV